MYILSATGSHAQDLDLFDPSAPHILPRPNRRPIASGSRRRDQETDDGDPDRIENSLFVDVFPTAGPFRCCSASAVGPSETRPCRTIGSGPHGSSAGGPRHI